MSFSISYHLPNLSTSANLFAISAHPNVKAFISHGGLLSTIEATHFGVPILGIPIYGDQFMNIERAVENGYALRINYHELNEETLLKNLEEILGNSTCVIHWKFPKTDWQLLLTVAGTKRTLNEDRLC